MSPSCCLWCGEKLTNQLSWSELLLLKTLKTRVCHECLRKLAPISGSICQGCGRDLQLIDTHYITSDNLCSDCHRWQETAWKDVLTLNRSLYTYNDFLRELIARYKFRGDVILAEGFRRDWQKLYQRYFSHYNIIVPMPLSRERLYERSFNQAERLASLLNKPYIDALIRVRHEEKQSKKSRKDRLARNDSPFMINPIQDRRIMNQPILLIDDIYTTGATLRWAATTLRKHGASEVVAMTLARG